MKQRYTLLAICLLVTLGGLYAGSICRGTEPRAADAVDHQSPVVTGPVLPPVSLDDEPAVPECRCKSVVAPLPRRSPVGPAGNASGFAFGASTRSLFGTQVANGQAARMVLYQYDFIPGRAGLATAGRRKLARIGPVLVQTPFPLIIEPTPSEPALDRVRRRRVIQALARSAYPVSDERVIVMPPPSRGLDGAEAHELHFQFLDAMSGGPRSDGGMIQDVR